jgi:hypothetical protein
MAIPDQIRKQVEQVDKHYSEVEDTTDVADVSAPDTEADSAVMSGTGNDGSGETVPEAGPSGTPQGEDWGHKYKTLQGMYNAEVPRLHQQNRELTTRLQQLEQLMATLPKVTESAPPSVTHLTDEDMAEYGESVEVMRRAAREEVATLAAKLASIEQSIAQVQSQVIPQVQHIARDQQNHAEQRFWATLAQEVPNFREVNGDAGFQQWLLAQDPMTGLNRQTYLEDAQSNLDAGRVVSIFNTWLASNAGQASPTAKKLSSANSQLEKQVAPGRSRTSGSAPPSSQSRTYTYQDIQKFYDDVRQGKYRGREKDRDRIERDIFSAQQDGRIVASA